MAGIEVLFGTLFLILLFLFFCQVVVWWHARNIMEQAAAEGARAAAAADATCAAAGSAAQGMAQRLGGSWVSGLDVACSGGDTPGSTIQVRVSASTPMFGIAGSLGVSATATAPSEGELASP